jgi:hypothetical protein
MAEFFAQRPKRTEFGKGNGFDAMGKPIPAYRRQAAYDTCRSIGLDTEAAWSAVNGMAENLERDQPYEAMAAGMKYIDLTGTYRVMAVILTAGKPRRVVRAAV